ncbi:hypothetical protein KI387_008838, partial [Taxus chinensis]
CTQTGYSDKAIEMFSHMQQAGIKPDAISIASVLPACTHMGALQQGYAQNSYDEEAVSLFRQMQLVGSKLGSITITNFLPACAHLASLHLGKEIHCRILRNGFESDIFVKNGLID